MIRVVSELRKCRGTRKKCRETRDDDDMSNKVEYWLMVSVLFAMNISKNLDRVDECSSMWTGSLSVYDLDGKGGVGHSAGSGEFHTI